jgi:hypothetical protein
VNLTLTENGCRWWVYIEERTIGTSRGKGCCKSLFLACQLSVFFCTGRIQGGQDCVFLFRGGLVNYKTHYGLSWFRPLFGGNSPTSSDFILKMNSGYKGVSRKHKKFMN